MKTIHRITSFFLTAVMAFSLIPASIFALADDTWAEPGNLDLNIINGGIMLTDGDEFYYSENGIYLERNGYSTQISPDAGTNLNLSGGFIYYTLSGGEVRRVPSGGGEPESVYNNGSDISKLYTIGENELRFVSGGKAYSHYINSGETVSRSGISGIINLIPTEYGDIYTTGTALNYSVYAGDTLVLENVTSCYTDSGYLAVNIDTVDYQILLERLFNGFSRSNDLQPFNIHGTESFATLFSIDEGAHVCAECEANAENWDFTVRLMTDDPGVDPGPGDLIPQVSQGQKNIVKRARQLHEIEWTPLEDRYQWGYRGVFKAGTTYTGLPYGQPVNTGYVGWTISFDKYMSSVNDNTSVFYSDYSWYNKVAPYYSTDCSGFVSYAWGMKFRHTTYNIPHDAERVSDQSIYSLQIGDCLNHSTSHVVLVSDVWYDAEGKVSSVEIMEQTPVITKLTRYGASGSKTLSTLQSYYLNGGYVIYRNPERDSVAYTHNCNVPIDGDYCANCKSSAPKIQTSSAIGSKTVSLSHKDSSAVIYYTLDGSTPTSSSTMYTTPITVNKTTKLRAIAVTTQFSGSQILEYSIKIPPAATPTFSVTSGTSSGNIISTGSQITLATASSGATIYYTLDGTEPTTSSSKYSSPITLTSDTTIRAMCQASGMTQSETAVISYKIGKTFTITSSAGAGGSISPSGSTKVLETTSKTFTIAANSGYKVKSVTVNGTSVGAVSSYTFSSISADATISATFEEIVDMPFTDVTQNDWFFSAANYVYKRGLFSGTSDTTFWPGGTMTRGMFVTVIARMSGQDKTLTGGSGIVTGSGVNIRQEPNTSSTVLGVADKYNAVQILGTSGEWYNIKKGSVTGYIRGDFIKKYDGTFTDLPSNEYYSAYVEWAYLTGIAGGTSMSTFSATTNITREEMCVMLYNYAEKFGIDLPQTNAKAAFNDDASISSGAKTAVYAMQQAGVVSGTGNGSFEPLATASRAHVAQIFKNFLEAIA